MSKSISKIKRFFWLISGSEISILEKCPADHNRHMNIGLAIFSTTLIAFLTGSLAGFKFGSQNIASALMFGAIWSLLVFTIDRNMVGTLQKNPNEKRGKLFWAILYRAFLSLLIAFFIAIPLELWIFKEQIAEQMPKDSDLEISILRKSKENRYNISGLKNNVQRDSTEQANFTTLLNQEEPPAGYKNYSANKSKLQKAKSDYNAIHRNYNKRVNLRKEYYSKAPEYYDTIQNRYIKERNTTYYNKWYELWIRTNKSGSETKALNQAKDEYEDLNNKVSSIKEEYFTEISINKQRSDSILIVNSNELAVSSDSVTIQTEEYGQLVHSQDGFIKQWIALNNVSEFWVIFFIWFIRLVFFVIEMLPTLTKVLTPLGSYDIKLYYQIREVESNAEYELELLKELQRKKMELTAINLTKIEEQKLNHELKLQEEILNNLAEKQNNIANNILNEWEKQQTVNANIDLSDFVNNNKS